MHTLISLSEKPEWNAALQRIRHSFAHTHEYCNAISSSHGDNIFLYSYVHGNDLFVCPLSERRFQYATDIVTPFGFSGFVGTGNVERFLHDWHVFARDSGYVCGYIGLNPLLSDEHFAHSTDYHVDNDVFVLDLQQSEARLMQCLSVNRRRQIRSFAREHVELTQDKHLLLEFFQSNLNRFLRSRGASAVYRFSRRTITELFESRGALTLGVIHENYIQSAVLFGYTAHCADYLFGISSNHGKRYSVPLLWKAALMLRSMGVPTLNLGGGISRDDSVAKFKLRFGASSLPLGCLKQVYRRDLYRILCEAVGADPGDRGCYFPAYRRSEKVTARGSAADVH